MAEHEKLGPLFLMELFCYEHWRLEFNWWPKRTARQHFVLLKADQRFK